jgi:hypothetical protein
MSSTVGKINGQMLENNLLRNGVDLAFDTDLIYLDVDNGRIGINTDTPFRPLLVNGTLSSTTVLVDTGTISDFSFALNTIANDANEILISAIGAGATITAGGIATDGISIDANGIRSLRSNEDIDLTPAGTGVINLLTNTEVNGAVHVTGNVTFDGNIVFGNNNLDSVSLSADINSDINPDLSSTYNLGSSTKNWSELHTNLVNGIAYTTGGAFVNGIDLGLRQGNTWYVATNGSYDNVGDHPNGPFDTVEKALSVATSGDTVLIYPGTYYELLPLTVPAGVTVKGSSIRDVTIKPDTSSGSENVFLLNGETTVEDLTIADFFYDSMNDTGYAFSFAPGFIVTSRSPYVRNITVITTGSITSGADPRGFAAGDAGKGAKVDGSLALFGTNEASMLFHSCTFITPGVDAITMTNGVRIEWLNCFTYFAERGLYAIRGTGRVTQDGSTLRYGAEIRSIGSANVYGTYGAVADGADTLMYLISHNFAYIGLDGDSENDPSSAIQVNEVVELNSGVVHYQTVDQSGNYRIGDLVTIEQSTGKIILNSVAISSTNITVTDGVTSSYIDAFEVTTGNISIGGNTVQSSTGGITFTASNNDIDITSNLTVSQLLTVEQLVTLDKNVTIGNSSSDTIYFTSRVNSNIIPNTNNLDLGINANRWKTLYTTQATFDDILINTNFISTTLSNSNLELAATGIGVIRIDALDVSSNVIASTSTNADININPNGTGKIQLLKDTDITGNLSVTGNINVGGNIQLGDVIIDSIDPVGKIGSDLMPNITGSYDIGSLTKTWRNLFMSNLVVDDIEVNDNYIRSTVSNSDLELRANGTGIINITDSVSVVQNLTVNGLTNLKNTNIDGLLTASAGLFITNNISASTFITDDIIFDENYFTTTLSNSNLELRANGTGNVVFDNVLQISGSTISNSVISGTEADRSIIFNPVSGKSVAVLSTKALQLPIGNNTNRTLVTDGEIRYNNSSSTFEGKITGRNISLYNLFDTDGNTGISPELTPGANDNTIRMYANNVLSATITAQAATFNRITVDEIDINNNVIGTINSNADLELERSGSGILNIKDSFNITDNIITNITLDAVTQIVSTGNGYVKFVGTGAIRIPHGLTAEQPLTAPIGATRYNITTNVQEVYNGTAWISAAGTGVDVVSAEDMELISDLYGLLFG